LIFSCLIENAPQKRGVGDLRYERLNMQIIETSIHKASGFLTYFFHTLIKQCQIVQLSACQIGHGDAKAVKPQPQFDRKLFPVY